MEGQSEKEINSDMDKQYQIQLAKIKLPAELNAAEQQEVRQMLWEEREAFAESEEVIGSADGYHHH